MDKDIFIMRIRKIIGFIAILFSIIFISSAHVLKRKKLEDKQFIIKQPKFNQTKTINESKMFTGVDMIMYH